MDVEFRVMIMGMDAPSRVTRVTARVRLVLGVLEMKMHDEKHEYNYCTCLSTPRT